MQRDDPGELPTVDDGFQERIRFFEIAHVPDNRCDGTVPSIEVGPAAIESDVVEVLHIADERVVFQSHAFNGLGERVEPFHAQVMAHAFFRRDL